MSLDCFNKSSIDNKISNKNIDNKKMKENHKYFKNLKFKIYSIYILVINISSFFYFIKNKNYKNRCLFNKNKRQNISDFKMKHAILVLSSYGLDYLNNF